MKVPLLQPKSCAASGKKKNAKELPPLPLLPAGKGRRREPARACFCVAGGLMSLPAGVPPFVFVRALGFRSL